MLSCVATVAVRSYGRVLAALPALLWVVSVVVREGNAH